MEVKGFVEDLRLAFWVDVRGLDSNLVQANHAVGYHGSIDDKGVLELIVAREKICFAHPHSHIGFLSEKVLILVKEVH